MSELSFGADAIHVSTRDAAHRIPLEDILYIESNHRVITIHTASDAYSCYEKLSTIEQHLDSFIRCHQSYLVAISQITGYDNQCLMLKDTSDGIPVSRQYQKKMRKFLQNDSAAGTLIGISGIYSDYIIRLQKEQPVLIGRDEEAADIIIQLPMVSRVHCKITYHAKERTYTIVDDSTNGTFVQEGTRLVPRQEYLLQPGTHLCFGDQTSVFQLL